jgi:hypothetical protein
MGDEFTPEVNSHSIFNSSDCTPIFVLDVEPLKMGSRKMRLKFFHATYMAGMQGKTYELKTLERGGNFILAKSTDHDPTPRILYIHKITWEWLENRLGIKKNPQDNDITEYLDRHYFRRSAATNKVYILSLNQFEDRFVGHYQCGEEFGKFEASAQEIFTWPSDMQFKDFEFYAAVWGKFDPYTAFLRNPVEIESLTYEDVSAAKSVYDERMRGADKP